MKKLFIAFLAIVLSISLNSSFAAFGVSKADSAVVSEDKAKADFNAAVTAFKSLSKRERRLKIKEAKTYLKEYKQSIKAGNEPTAKVDVLLVILAILLPPLAVYLHQKAFNSKFWISLLLWLLFALPGIIYALLVVFNVV